MNKCIIASIYMPSFRRNFGLLDGDEGGAGGDDDYRTGCDAPARSPAQDHAKLDLSRPGI